MDSTAGSSDELLDRYFREQRWNDAIALLQQLVQQNPDSFPYVARFAYLLDSMGQTGAAIEAYVQFLQRQPQVAGAHFNVGGLFRKIKEYDRALAGYDEAIRLNLDGIEEAYLNKGNLYSNIHRTEDAKGMYEQALEARPDYIPALFNLAGLYEEQGDRKHAARLYEQILELDPRFWDALARLAHLDNSGDPMLVDRLESAWQAADDAGREVLGFALGKVLDGLQRYEDAAAAYQEANAARQQRGPAYDRELTERGFDQLMEVYSREWIEDSASGSASEPIFICGMYRSGSTLLELFLSAHPDVEAGGELDTLPWLIERNFAAFPQGILEATGEKLRALADFYDADVRRFFPHGRFVTDKRPDNFMDLGLIKAMFPKARIIHTVRAMEDNCLSVYFQQFGDRLTYASDVGDIAHYYRQQERLKAHWEECFGEDIVTVRYEDLVESTETVLRDVFEQIDIEWHDGVLEPANTGDTRVRTASIWQVRRAPHRRSVGRARNYAGLLEKSLA